MRALAVVVAVGCVVLASGRGWAQAPVLVVDVTGCPELDGAVVQRIVDMEMSAGSLPSDGDTTRAVVRCERSAARIAVSDPVTGKAVARTIALVGTPSDARERLIALAVVELAISSWVELEAVPEPVAPAVERTASPAARTTVHRVVRPRLRRTPPPDAVFAGVARVGHGSLGFTGGAGLVWRFDRGPRWGWSADLAFARASQSTMAGRVVVDVVSGGAGVHAHTVAGAVAVSAGAGVRVEVVRVLGEPVDTEVAIGDSFLAPTGGPRVELAARTPAVGGATVVVLAEAGYRVVGARGRVPDEPSVAVDGAWLSVSAGLGWSW